MPNDKIISVLLGLIGACNNNPKSSGTDAVVLKSLAFLHLNPEADEDIIDTLISEIRIEKNIIAPGCAVCASPCGNTSDYDMKMIYDAEEGIRDVKLRILAELQEMAAFIIGHKNIALIYEEFVGIFYKALAYVSYDLEERDLLAVLSEVQEIGEYIRSIDHDQENN